MKLSLTTGLIILVFLFGACSRNSTSDNGQPQAPGEAGQPAPSGQAAPPNQVDSSSEEAADYAPDPPPALPEYEQPDIPGPGYIWTPGYWAWSAADGDYYWVPGTWVEPPEPDVLWTPGYWGSDSGRYVWHHGYWGSHVGFYGGINYGNGYTGDGYEGGHWDHDSFYYNRAVNNIANAQGITNVYDQNVNNNMPVNNYSYNGNGGVNAHPTVAQRLVEVERHIPRTAEQTHHQEAASSDRELHASENRGKPPIAATSRPGMFTGGGVVAARAAAPYQPPPRLITPRNEPQPQAAQPRIEQRPEAMPPRNEPRPQAAQPRYQQPPQAMPPRNEPRPQAAQPRYQQPPQAPPPRNEPRPQAAPARIQPPPQAAPPRIEPHPQAAPPRNVPHPPAEKPKDEHEPPR